jgi:hypothetical protein
VPFSPLPFGAFAVIVQESYPYSRISEEYRGTSPEAVPWRSPPQILGHSPLPAR